MKGIPRELIGKIGAKGIVNMVARADRAAAGRIAKGLVEGGLGEALTETGQEGLFALIEDEVVQTYLLSNYGSAWSRHLLEAARRV